MRAHACFCYQFLFAKISYRFNPILLEHTQRHQITRLATLRHFHAVTSAMQLRLEQAENGAHLIADRLRRNAAIATRQLAAAEPARIRRLVATAETHLGHAVSGGHSQIDAELARRHAHVSHQLTALQAHLRERSSVRRVGLAPVVAEIAGAVQDKEEAPRLLEGQQFWGLHQEQLLAKRQFELGCGRWGFGS